MTPQERHQRVKAIFNEARALPEQERGAFVESRCAENPSLADEVLTLLEQPKSPWSPLPDGAAARGLEPTQFRRLAEAAAARGPLAHADAHPLLGKRIGRYLIVGALAEGGMGTVFKAEQAEPSRVVALKLIRAGVISGDALRRFELESRVLGLLSHPGIAQVYEAGRDDSGRPFFAMEFVPGGRSLVEYARSEGLTSRARLSLLAQVCDAVHHGHQKGVIHRDLKPSNILVDLRSGAAQPKVIDFGVARATDADVAATTLETQAGQVVGTLRYMSPEQCGGNPHAVDTRSDVYALGVIAYELLTGLMPYELSGTTLASALSVIRETRPVPLSAIDPALRGDWETLVLKALEKEPQQRYQSAADMAADIRRLLADEPLTARPPSAVYLARKFVRRHRTGVMAAGLAVIALVVGTVVSSAMYLRADKQRALAGVRAEELARRVYAQQIGLAQAAVRESDADRAHALLNACAPERRGWEWKHLDWLADRSERTLTFGGGEPVRRAVISSSGDRIYAIGERGTLCAWARGDRDEWGLVLDAPPGSEPWVGIALSPDDRLLATGGYEGRICVWDAKTPTAPIQVASGIGPVSSLAFSPDGSLLAAGGMDSRVRVVDVARRELTATLTGHLAGVLAACFAPDGRLWYSGADGSVRLCDVASASPLGAVREHSSSVNALACSRDGNWVAGAGDDGVIVLIDARELRAVRTMRASDAPVRALCFTPDGAGLFAGTGDGAVRLWDLGRGVERWSVCAHGGTSSCALTENGRRLLTAGQDGKINLWDSFLGSGQPVLANLPEPITNIVYSPDGARIAVAGMGTGLEVRDACTGELLLVPSLEGYQNGIAWSADGTRLFAGGIRGVLRACDLRGEERIEGPSVRESAIQVVAASRDGRWVAAGRQNGRLDLYDAASLKVERTLLEAGASILGVAFAPDGTVLAGATDSRLYLWRCPSGEPVGTAADSFAPICFSGDGTRLAAASADFSVTVRNAKTLAPIAVLKGHQRGLLWVEFSPDRSRLATASADGTLRLWEAATGQELIAFALGGPITRCRFSPDGRTVACSTGDGRLTLFETAQPPVEPGARLDVSEAARAVDREFDLRGVSEDVIVALRADTSRTPAVRDAAVRIASAHGDNPVALNGAAWTVASSPTADAAAYRLAVRRAEVAARLRPDDGATANTLGVAQFRAGDFDAALNTLRRSEQLNAARGPRPADLAFEAMSLWRLGRRDEARTTLDRLRNVMDRAASDATTLSTESRAFRREAEALITADR